MRCPKQSESHNPSWWPRYHLPSQLPAQEEVLGNLGSTICPGQKPQGAALAVSSGAAVVWEAARGQPYRGFWQMLGYRPVPLQGSSYWRLVCTSSNLSVCTNFPGFLVEKCTFSST